MTCRTYSKPLYVTSTDQANPLLPHTTKFNNEKIQLLKEIGCLDRTERHLHIYRLVLLRPTSSLGIQRHHWRDVLLRAPIRCPSRISIWCREVSQPGDSLCLRRINPLKSSTVAFRSTRILSSSPLLTIYALGGIHDEIGSMKKSERLR